MCYDYDRLELLRKELEKEEGLRTQQSRAQTPAKPDTSEEDLGKREPVPA